MERRLQVPYTVLITGGLGFIGSHCAKKFLRLGYKVIILDNLSNNCVSPDDQDISKAKIIIGNVSDISKYDIDSIDIILHLASPIGTVSLLDKPGRIANSIIYDMYSILDFAEINNSKIVFASTCEIYGSPFKLGKLSENEDKIISGEYSIRNEYSISKMLCEVILKNSSLLNKIKYQIIRPFNVVGPGQQWKSGHVVPRFISQAKSGSPLTVYGDGLQERCFTWVGDTVEAIYLVSTCEDSLWNNIWNIGNSNNKTPIVDLANMIIKECGSSSKISFVDPKDLHGNQFEDAPIKIPDHSKSRDLLGWNPTVGVSEIIRNILKNE